MHPLNYPEEGGGGGREESVAPGIYGRHDILLKRSEESTQDHLQMKGSVKHAHTQVGGFFRGVKFPPVEMYARTCGHPPSPD